MRRLGLFEVWVCAKFGFVRSLGFSEFRFVRRLGLFDAWDCSKFGFVRSLGLFDSTDSGFYPSASSPLRFSLRSTFYAMRPSIP